MKIKFLFSLAVLSLLFTSCSKSDLSLNEELSSNEQATQPISQERIEFMESLSVNLEDATLISVDYPDGTSEEVYLVDGDIMIPKKEYEELTNPENAIALRQWYTGHTVTNWQNIHVLGFNGGPFGLTNNMQTGLANAIWNYQMLDIGLTFTFGFGTSTAELENADIVVLRAMEGSGGFAGFPSGGVPWKWVVINTGLDNGDLEVIEHVISHEIAHCLGMRHNDWETRISCNENVNEGFLHVHIPGTPMGVDYSENVSLFNACYNPSTDGNFNTNDRTMLEYLYPPAYIANDSWTTASDGSRGWHIGDFNGDGSDDIFRYNSGTCGAEVFLSNGFSFVNAGCWTLAGVEESGWHIGDFNGDGKDDIFRYNQGSCGAEVFLSNGNSFVSAGCWTTAGNGNRGWYIGDFNGDGKDDIFRYNEESCGAEVLLSNGSSFNNPTCWTLAGANAGDWYLGDFNGDGKTDIFRYNEGVCGAEMFLSTGSSFSGINCWTTTGYGDRDWHLGDFDGDGNADIFRYNEGNCGAAMMLSTGSSFAGINCWTTAGSGERDWPVGDFNGDGRADIFRYLPGISGADVFLSTGNSF